MLRGDTKAYTVCVFAAAAAWVCVAAAAAAGAAASVSPILHSGDINHQ